MQQVLVSLAMIFSLCDMVFIRCLLSGSWRALSREAKTSDHSPGSISGKPITALRKVGFGRGLLASGFNRLFRRVRLIGSNRVLRSEAREFNSKGDEVPISCSHSHSSR